MNPLDALLAQGIAEGVFPRGAYAVGTADSIVLGGEVGTWFDLASVTKVVATTTCALRLVSEGTWSFETPWRELLPEVPDAFGEVVLRDVLCHRAGYLPHRRLDLAYATPAEAWQGLLAEPLAYEPRSESQYSCLGFLLLGLVIERAEGRPFSEVALDVLGEGFAFGHPEAAPCEGVRGVVHDENARFLAPNTGNAGLFGTARSVGEFAQNVLRAVRLGEDAYGVRAEVWREATTRQAPLSPSAGRGVEGEGPGASSRALGWDTKSEGSSAGEAFGERSFGHTGFTGTSIWIDPDAQAFSVLLTNRVEPTRENERIKEYRPIFNSGAHKFVKST